MPRSPASWLICAMRSVRPVIAKHRADTVRRSPPFDDGGSPAPQRSAHEPTQSVGAHRRLTRASGGQGTLWSIPVEEGRRSLQREDTASVAPGRSTTWCRRLLPAPARDCGPQPSERKARGVEVLL